jgi:hypothetical protein
MRVAKPTPRPREAGLRGAVGEPDGRGRIVEGIPLDSGQGDECVVDRREASERGVQGVVCSAPVEVLVDARREVRLILGCRQCGEEPFVSSTAPRRVASDIPCGDEQPRQQRAVDETRGVTTAPQFEEDHCCEVFGIRGQRARTEENPEHAISMLLEKHAERALVTAEDAVPQCSIVMLHTSIVSGRRDWLRLFPESRREKLYA